MAIIGDETAGYQKKIGPSPTIDARKSVATGVRWKLRLAGDEGAKGRPFGPPLAGREGQGNAASWTAAPISFVSFNPRGFSRREEVD